MRKYNHCRAYRVTHILWIIVAIVGITTTAGAQAIHVGGGVGGYMPTGDAADSLSFGLTLHGTFLYTLRNYMQVEGGLGYWALRFDDETSDEADDLGIDISGSMIPFTGGIRYPMSPQLALHAGGGFYRIEMEALMGLIEVSQTDLGIYGGLGYQTGPVNLIFRTHFPDFDDLYFTAAVEYLVKMQ